MRYALALFLLLSGVASAQSVSLTNYINAQLPNNVSRSITAANVRNSILAFPNNIYVSSSFPITTTSYVSASRFFGNGSGLTGIVGASSTSPGGVSTSVQINNGTTNSLYGDGLFTYASGLMQVPSISATNISVTGPISASTYYGDGSHLTGIIAGSVNYSALVGIPPVLANISASTGSVTVTSINAATATLTSIGAGSLTASGIVSANVLDSFILSTTAINGSNATLTGGLTTGAVAASGVVSAGTISGSALNASVASITTLTVGAGGCSGCSGAASPGGPSGSIQFNLAGTSISGSTNFVTVNNQVGLGFTAPNAKLDVNGIISSTGANIAGGVTATTTIQSGGLLTALAGVNVTGAVTATTTLQSGGLLTALAGVNVTGAITATTSIQGAIVSATNALYAKQISATNISASTISASTYAVDTSTVASNSQVMYISGTAMDGALGICYDRVQNFTYFGVPTGGSCPANNTVSTTLQVSGTTTTNNMREGITTLSASASPTVINMGLTTMVSMSIITNTTISLTNANNVLANVVVLKSTQDATGGRAITWPANARFSGNTSPTINTTANTSSLFTLTPLPGSANILVTMPATGVSN